MTKLKTNQFSRIPGQSVEGPAAHRFREAVILDRLFWFSIGMFLVSGITLRVWGMLY